MNTTPLSDGWRERTKTALQPRGRRAALSRWLAASYGGGAQTWAVQLARVLNQGVRIDLELALAVEGWLAALPSLRKDKASTRGTDGRGSRASGVRT